MSQETINLGVVMDPIATIKVQKDSTFAMLLEAQARGWNIWYMEQPDLFLREARLWAQMSPLRVQDDPTHWFDLGNKRLAPVGELDVVLMRKDPPFDMEYVYTTYMLEAAEREGSLVVNQPRALRDANEKVFTTRFPQCIPPTLVSCNIKEFKSFIESEGRAVVKPLDGMGGTSVFQLEPGSRNTNVILETLTDHGRRFAMVQRFLPAIDTEGDKRILLIEGDPIPYALARIPPEGDSRGNLAVGGKGHGVDLTERDRWICEQVGPTLRQMGLLFVGLDVIGEHLTEVNVTSPTCIRELDRIYGLNISARLLDAIEARLGH